MPAPVPDDQLPDPQQPAQPRHPVDAGQLSARDPVRALDDDFESAAQPAQPARTARGTVVAVIPAYEEAARISETIAAVWRIPEVGRVVVVDDGSTDDTAVLAAAAGALVISHPRRLGKAAALQTGVDASPGTGPLLLLDADLAVSASAAAELIPPVLAGEVDAAIATMPPQIRPDGSPAGGRGLVVKLSRTGIRLRTGYEAAQPLSGQRCLTRAAFAAVRPLARGFGVETAMTIDLLRLGFRVREIPVPLAHRATGDDLAGRLHRARQLVDVGAALGAGLLARGRG